MSTARWAWMLAVMAAYALLCLVVARRHRRDRIDREQQGAALSTADASRARSADSMADSTGDEVLVLHASQTGQAESLAWHAAQALHAAGQAVRLRPLGEVRPDDLRTVRRSLLVLSTTGEGDAPDSAQAFVRHGIDLASWPDLSHLQMGVLALGDRRYAHFCAFAHRVHACLRRAGAKDAFDLIEVDAMDAGALQRWRQAVQGWGAMPIITADSKSDQPSAVHPDMPTTAWEAWRLIQRKHLNPGSQGEPVYHLELVPDAPQAALTWRAGDLVQVLPPGDAAHPRDYTIASLPQDGHVHLMVRLARREDGSVGQCSSWLGQQLSVGDCVPLRLKPHPVFRSCDHADRPLILIGSGTGLAGLLVHLKARLLQRQAEASAAPVWLLYGERQAAHDAHYRDWLAQWQREGVLRHLDWAFSRDGTPCRVQDALQQQAGRLRDWLAQGAALYVCGSRQRMGAAVDAQLRALLGDGVVEHLQQQGRYRRDVY